MTEKVTGNIQIDLTLSQIKFAFIDNKPAIVSEHEILSTDNAVSLRPLKDCWSFVTDKGERNLNILLVDVNGDIEIQKIHPKDAAPYIVEERSINTNESLSETSSSSLFSLNFDDIARNFASETRDENLSSEPDVCKDDAGKEDETVPENISGENSFRTPGMNIPDSGNDFVSGTSRIEIDLNNCSGIITFGDNIENEMRLVLEADGSAACDREKFVSRNPFVEIEDISARLEFGKWLLSFKWLSDNHEIKKIPISISDSTGSLVRAKIVVPDGELEVENDNSSASSLIDNLDAESGSEFNDDVLSASCMITENEEERDMPLPAHFHFEDEGNDPWAIDTASVQDDDSSRFLTEEEEAPASGYFVFEMGDGFIEIGETVIHLCNEPSVVRTGHVFSKDYSLENFRAEREGEGAWRVVYDFRAGCGENDCIPVKFIDDNGGMFAKIIADENGTPILVAQGQEEYARRSYGKFNAFYGDSRVTFFADGMAGNPVGEGARFVFQEGIFSIYHMGGGWYVYEFEPSDEWTCKRLEKKISLRLVDEAGDEAEITLKIHLDASQDTGETKWNQE